ncbi:MAG: hypothetical protein JXR97_12210, partial [Planctomycetes bacterium]|nr:hypothetical protein [Planctomycetota bacterium]
IFRDAAMGAGDLIATGTLNGNTQGLVDLQGVAPDYADIKGSVYVEMDPAVPVGGTLTMDLEATFATVGDLINEINSSNTYTSARVAENGQSIDIISHLGGAYLTIAEDVLTAQRFGDNSGVGGQPQLSQMDLHGLVKGVNADNYGNVYAAIEDTGGVGAGPFEVRLYSDRQHQNLVASGSLPGPATAGLITLNEQNDSGLMGSVYLNYNNAVPGAGDDSDIVVSPGGARVYNDEYNHVSQVDIPNIIPGVNADLQGNQYLEVVDAGGGNYNISLYADKSKTRLVAQQLGVAVPAAGTYVTLTEQNLSGITNARLYVNQGPTDTDIVLKPGSLRLGGQVREQNIFSTFNDVIDAMHANDSEELGNLIGNYTDALNRLLFGRSEIGSRQNRLEMLSNRHADEEINFGQIRSERIDLDYSKAIVEFQAQQNVFEASLRTSAQLIPLSLVDFI